jgi:zinc protease
MGGNENAFTSWDYTGYFQRVPSDQLLTMMGFEADRMTGLVLTDDVVLPERDVVLEEYNMRVANSPDARLQEQALAALYLNHPYGRPVIGWRPEIEKLNRDDALAFYRRFYAPNNAIVVIAGDVTPEQVRDYAEKTYGQIPARPDISPDRIRPQEPPPIAMRTVTFADPRVEQPLLRQYYLVPSATTAAKANSAALDVLAQILGSGRTSLLYRSLVVDRGLAIDVGANYQSSSLDLTQFTITGVPKAGVEFSKLESAIADVLQDVVAHGVKAEDLERVKTQLISEAIYAQDNQASMARWYGSALSIGLGIDDLLAWPDRIRSVTSDQLREAARRWLDHSHSVTGYLIKQTDTPRAEDKHS